MVEGDISKRGGRTTNNYNAFSNHDNDNNDATLMLEGGKSLITAVREQ